MTFTFLPFGCPPLGEVIGEKNWARIMDLAAKMLPAR